MTTYSEEHSWTTNLSSSWASLRPQQSPMPAARLLALLPSPPPRGMHLAARLASAAAGAAAVAADALAASASDRVVAVATLCCGAHAHAALRLRCVVASRGCALLLRGACRLECRRGAPCFLGRCGILARTQRPETRLVQRRRAHVLGRITSGRGLGCSAARCLCSHPRVRPSCPPRQRDAAGCDVSSSADRLRGDDGRAPTEPERRVALRRQRRRRSHPPRHWPR